MQASVPDPVPPPTSIIETIFKDENLKRILESQQQTNVKFWFLAVNALNKGQNPAKYLAVGMEHYLLSGINQDMFSEDTYFGNYKCSDINKLSIVANKYGLFCVQDTKTNDVYVWQPQHKKDVINAAIKQICSEKASSPQGGGRYTSKTLKELQAIAKAKKLPYSGLKKAELIALLRKR